MCCANTVLVAEVRALFLQCVFLVNDTVLLLFCARDGVWRGAVRKPCTLVVCTEAIDPPTATVDAAVLQQMAYENTIRCTVTTVRGSGPPTCA